jgi:osmotically-inducible protein OsmY
VQEVIMKSDSRLRQDVRAELDLEPSVPMSRIRVQVSDGAVTLAGEVSSYADKWSAERAARRVAGVRSLAMALSVRASPMDRWPDADIARAAENVLQCSSFVPRNSVTIAVENGRIILGGAVDWHYQKLAAVSAVRMLAGASGIDDRIALRPNVSDQAVKERIEAALRRRADVEAGTVIVKVQGAQVSLYGAVHDWSEHDLATNSAWEIQGVRHVVDMLTIAC